MFCSGISRICCGAWKRGRSVRLVIGFIIFFIIRRTRRNLRNGIGWKKRTVLTFAVSSLGFMRVILFKKQAVVIKF